jgi:hypothetical protein
VIRAALALGALVWAASAHGDFVRGSIKVDVRDAAGKPREADVAVTSAAGETKVARVGEVYIADGLLDGVYTVTVAGAAPQTVSVKGRLDRGIVFVVGGKKPQTFA